MLGRVKPSSATALTDPTLQFLQTLWALDHGLQSHSKRMKTRTGVTGPQRLLLRILSKHPGAAPSQLARLLFFDKGTVTVILRTLERSGFVRRRPNPADARGVLLDLTPKGRRVARESRATVEAVVRATLAQVSDADIRTTRKVLDQLAAAFA